MSKVDDVLAYAQLELGKPYIFGDEGPDTFDCSGLVEWVYGKVGIKVPRIADQQQAATTRITDPRPGDLVFYGDPAYHVGIYIGDGKMIDAPSAGQKVRVDSVGNPTNYGRVSGLGTALAPFTNAVGGVSSTVAGWLGGARAVVLEGAFVALGVVLLGFGAYRAIKPHIPSPSTVLKGA